MFDRFNVGAGARPEGDPKNGRTRHGGNIRGTIDKLDYLHDLGVTTLLLSPIFKNAPDGYHGYSITDFLSTDPRLGTMDDFRELVGKAHERGMRVLLDLPLNYAASVFDYSGDSKWVPLDQPAKQIDHWNYDIQPAVLQSPEHYALHGVLDNWDDPDQQENADFPPFLRRFNLGNSPTQEILIGIAQFWLQQTDIDGYRLDAYKHMPSAFRKNLVQEMGDYAASLGKKNFMLLGEIMSGNHEEIARYLREIPHLYNYPDFYRTVLHYNQGVFQGLLALHGQAGADRLIDAFWESYRHFGDKLLGMLRFMDTHDTFRYLKDPSIPAVSLRPALAYVWASMGIPIIDWGTEQGMRQIGNDTHYDPGNRGDQFDRGQYKPEAAPGDETNPGHMFDSSSPLFGWVAALNAARKKLYPLRHGMEWPRYGEKDGRIFAFSRIHGDEEVVVVINTSPEPRYATFPVDSNITPPNTVLADVLDPQYTTRADGSDQGSVVMVVVPPYSARYLVRRQAQ